MEHEPPRPVQDAARKLLEVCLSAADEHEDVRRALTTLNAWIARELERTRPSSQARASHGVLTPQSRTGSPRVAASGSTRPSGGDAERLTEPLSIVVQRARWKAAACRLALDKRVLANAGDEASEEALQQIAGRERSLRSRLQGLPDTSAWMLDIPFGTRVSESNAFNVGDDQAERLRHVADCYETVALGAETAMELEESGSFRNGPVPSFLYLLAEAQSALLHSLHDAPTRNDSDQRDVFLWLKDQTTRYRIYVDRHMRLDDPADIRGSQDLSERIRRTSREIIDARKARRERGQILNKIRYHVGKLSEGGDVRRDEVDSLAAALDRWTAAGNATSDRAVGELLRSLNTHVDGLEEAESTEGAEALSRLRDLLDEHKSARRGAGGKSERTVDDEARAKELVEQVNELLAKRSVLLLAPPDQEVDVEALGDELGTADLGIEKIDVEGPVAERTEALESHVNSDEYDLVLLGVRLATDEYQSFKDSCLERRKPFVRLPGAVTAAAIAHQISRQVGWRLRAMRDQDSRVS